MGYWLEDVVVIVIRITFSDGHFKFSISSMQGRAKVKVFKIMSRDYRITVYL